MALFGIQSRLCTTNVGEGERFRCLNRYINMDTPSSVQLSPLPITDVTQATQWLKNLAAWWTEPNGESETPFPQ